jgi:hypothetical protein
MDYRLLNTYCEKKKILYKEFHAMVDPDHEIAWITIYFVITGRQKAGKRSGRLLDKFIASHRAEIEEALAGVEEKEAV